MAFGFLQRGRVCSPFFDHAQEKVTGTVKLKLYKGGVYPIGRKSPNSLYSPDLVTFEEDDVYNQADATGFIRIQGLRLMARYGTFK